MRLLSSLLILTAAAGTAEIIDRVAVSVDNTTIAMSEVVRQIRITALLNNEEPDLSPDSKRETAERLVQQYLIRREINISRYVPNNMQQADILFKNFRARYKTDEEYKAALTKYRVSEADARTAFNWQAAFLEFIEVRFRPGITIPEEELKAAYDAQIKGAAPPEAGMSFEEARGLVEKNITQQRVDNALDRWLGQVSTQTRIVYRKEAFQ
ncbi:MAG: hypothetical protein SGI92_33455 [Bryobacteraceae bacterium]|nr:hypothetical protein [Bryobacteraceae bacterium]